MGVKPEGRAITVKKQQIKVIMHYIADIPKMITFMSGILEKSPVLYMSASFACSMNRPPRGKVKEYLKIAYRSRHALHAAGTKK